MKKQLTISCFSILVLLFISIRAEAQSGFYFKLSGGLNYVHGGDLNKGLKGWSDIWSKFYDMTGITQKGGYKPFHLGEEFNVEILHLITPRLGVGIGAGYFQASKSSELQINEGGNTFKFTWSPKISATSIEINFYYYLLKWKAVKLAFFVGADYYLGKYTDKHDVVFIGESIDEYNTSAKGQGFHGGIRLEIAFSSRVSFLIETKGQLASLSNFSGELNSNWSSILSKTEGKLWYYEIEAFDSEIFPIVSLDTDKPEGLDIHNLREVKVDLNGMSINLGFLYRF